MKKIIHSEFFLFIMVGLAISVLFSLITFGYLWDFIIELFKGEMVLSFEVIIIVVIIMLTNAIMTPLTFKDQGKHNISEFIQHYFKLLICMLVISLLISAVITKIYDLSSLNSQLSLALKM